MEGLNCRELSLWTVTSLSNIGCTRGSRSGTIEALRAAECGRAPLLGLAAQ
jgi:hypothetical protein